MLKKSLDVNKGVKEGFGVAPPPQKNSSLSLGNERGYRGGFKYTVITQRLVLFGFGWCHCETIPTKSEGEAVSITGLEIASSLRSSQ